MDFNRTTTDVTINPYAKRSTAEASESNDSTNNVDINTVVTNLNMGNQSQLRNGAIKKCKKMATKRLYKKQAYKQNAIGGGVAFVEKLHCILCKARHLQKQGKKVSLPHRPPDLRRHINRKTRGLSKWPSLVTRESAR